MYTTCTYGLAADLMDKRALLITDKEFYQILQECIHKQDVAAGNHLFFLTTCHKVDAIDVFGDYLVRFFSGCGSLPDARAVFHAIAKRTVYTWHAIISAYISHGQGELALMSYHQMQEEGVSPNQHVYTSILKACGSAGPRCLGKHMHAQILGCGLEVDLASENALLDMYVKTGSLGTAQKIFDELLERDVVSWTTMIAGYMQVGLPFNALLLFEEMQDKGTRPNRVTLLYVVKACGAIGITEQSRCVHDQIVRDRLEGQTDISNALIDMYAKCKLVKEAESIFNSMSNHDHVSRGTLMWGYAESGNDVLALEYFDRLCEEAVQLNEAMLVCGLKACSKLEVLRQGKVLHDLVVRSALELNTEIGDALVDMYAKCRCLDEARVVFERVKSGNEVLWGILISGYSEEGDGHVALELFERLQSQGIVPNQFILSSVMKACGSLGALPQGKIIHFQIVTSTFELEAVVRNAIVDMYAKCGSLIDAVDVFRKPPNRDTITWGSMMAGYAQHGLGHLAIDLFEDMQEEGIPANEVIISSMLKACATINAIRQGEGFYDMVIRSGFDSNLVIANALIDMYVHCECLQEAQRVFDVSPDRDDVSWGTLITGYAQLGFSLKALQCFKKMLIAGSKPNKVVVLGIARACGSIGALHQAKLVHDQIVQEGLDLDMEIESMLIDTYSKCGSLQDTCRVFHRMNLRDGVAWGVMSAACAHYGKWGLSKQYYEQMEQHGWELLGAGCNSMLSAYSHTGRVEAAQHLLGSLKSGELFSVNGYNGMSDLLSRSGLLEEARLILNTTPIVPDNIGFVSLLTASKTYGVMELARDCLDKAASLSANKAASFALMSSMCADLYLARDVSDVEDLRACLRAWKKPGMAWIDVGDTLHEFCVGNPANHRSEAMSPLLKRLLAASKGDGFVPNIDYSIGFDHKRHMYKECNEAILSTGSILSFLDTDSK